MSPLDVTHSEFALSFMGIAGLILFVGVLIVVHVFAAKKKAASLRRRYFIALGITFFITLFIPVLHDASKFGWIPVSAAYVLLPASLLQSKDDLIRVFLLCYAVVAAQHAVCIAAAFLLTRKNEKA